MDLFARELNEHIQRAYVIGEVGVEMVREFNTFDTPAVQCFSLQEAVECAYSEAKGSVSISLVLVLLVSINFATTKIEVIYLISLS